jgi:AraC-like DNA-binding protein
MLVMLFAGTGIVGFANYFIIKNLIPSLYGFLPERKFIADVTTEDMKPRVVQGPLVADAQNEEKILPVTVEKAGRDDNILPSAISEEEIVAEAAIVLLHMKEKKPFLKLGYSIQDLSNETGIPIYQLSPLINGHFNMNFANWVNRYRIEYFIEMVPENPLLTLEALSKKAGFISRSTFINAFKKEKGMTPREFFKGQKLPE